MSALQAKRASFASCMKPIPWPSSWNRRAAPRSTAKPAFWTSSPRPCISASAWFWAPGTRSSACGATTRTTDAGGGCTRARGSRRLLTLQGQQDSGADRLARSQGLMRAAHIAQGEALADLHPDTAFADQAEQVFGRVGQLLPRRRVIADGGARDVQRTLGRQDAEVHPVDR